jgi:hypothetical protein
MAHYKDGKELPPIENDSGMWITGLIIFGPIVGLFIVTVYYLLVGN